MQISSVPMQVCQLCGFSEEVRPDGRGFPPAIAERRLRKACKAAGCECEPVYRAGFVLTFTEKPE